LARAKWVALETKEALPANELAPLLRESYDMVFAGLPKKMQERLAQPAKARRPKSARRRRGKSQNSKPSKSKKSTKS
jgi:hypothetical protein